MSLQFTPKGKGNIIMNNSMAAVILVSETNLSSASYQAHTFRCSWGLFKNDNGKDLTTLHPTVVSDVKHRKRVFLFSLPEYNRDSPLLCSINIIVSIIILILLLHLVWIAVWSARLYSVRCATFIWCLPETLNITRVTRMASSWLEACGNSYIQPGMLHDDNDYDDDRNGSGVVHWVPVILRTHSLGKPGLLGHFSTETNSSHFLFGFSYALLTLVFYPDHYSWTLFPLSPQLFLDPAVDNASKEASSDLLVAERCCENAGFAVVAS